jgi:hypothetical protein
VLVFVPRCVNKVMCEPNLNFLPQNPTAVVKMPRDTGPYLSSANHVFPLFCYRFGGRHEDFGRGKL